MSAVTPCPLCWATEAAKVDAARRCIDPCDVLAEMLEAAKKGGDTKRANDIEEAQKYLGCRNKKKRRSIYNTDMEKR
jgi:Bacterial toxin 34